MDRKYLIYFSTIFFAAYVLIFNLKLVDLAIIYFYEVIILCFFSLIRIRKNKEPEKVIINRKEYYQYSIPGMIAIFVMYVCFIIIYLFALMFKFAPNQPLFSVEYLPGVFVFIITNLVGFHSNSPLSKLERHSVYPILGPFLLLWLLALVGSFWNTIFGALLFVFVRLLVDLWSESTLKNKKDELN